MTGRFVEVKIELGHKAVLKEKPTNDGYTHDWTVFVRGPEGYRIDHFVEKVIFQLHESFPKSKRTIREPPFEVKESGYAGFNMPVWVYFKTKEDPKKIEFIYDLFLSLDGMAINNVRCEKLTFHNPPEDFCAKLFKGGGSYKVQSSSPGKKPLTPPQKKSPQPIAAAPAATPVAAAVASAAATTPMTTAVLPASSKPFNDMFGTPMVKQEPKQTEKKEKKKDKRDKDYKKDKKREERRDGKDIRNSEKPREKVKTERIPSPEVPKKEERPTVKEEKSRDDSSPTERMKGSPSEDKDAKRKKKKLSSHKDSPDPKRPRMDDPLIASKLKKIPKPPKEPVAASPAPPEPEDPDLSFTPTSNFDIARKKKSPARAMPERKEIRQPSLPPPAAKIPKKSSSSSPDLKKRIKSTQPGALATMMMELDGHERLSPEAEAVPEDRKRDRLSLLKVKILKLSDDKLQQVVDLIEETGKFVLSEETFDFDLRKIDAPTISRIQQLVT